jgi:high-affinity iron transporter
MVAGAAACLVVILALTADFIYARASTAQPRLTQLAAQGNEVRVPIRDVQDGDMHLFSTDIGGGQVIRFMIIKKPDGWGTALDACRICGADGYRQDGQNVICRHCGSAIYVPTIGQAGGCNPIGVPSHIDGTNLVVEISALSEATHEIPK